MLSFKMSKYIGSKTLMICFFQSLLHGGACPVSLEVLIPNKFWVSVPSVLAASRPGACGLVQIVGSLSLVGEIIA
jgi:hypothetical protein